MASFKPTERQQLIWNAIARGTPGSRTIIGYGGAAGGGKTRALVEVAYDLAVQYPGNKILIARKDFSDLRSTTLEEFDKSAPPGLVVKANNQENWRDIRAAGWPRGVKSRVIFRELKDYLGLGSEEYGAVIIDEAGEVPENSALMLLSRLRHKLPEIVQNKGFSMKWVFLAASNPYPGWFKEWFVDRLLDENMLARFNATIEFIPAFARDNPYLDSNYESFLRAIYPEPWVKRMLDGSWEVFVGQVYPGFDPQTHAWKRVDPRTGLWDIPQFDYLIGGLDFGMAQSQSHRTAGVVGGVYNNRLLRLAMFERAGPDVMKELFQWMQAQEEEYLPMIKPSVLKRTAEPPRIEWVADRTQFGLIETLRGQGAFHVRPSKGGQHTVQWGINLVSARLAVDDNGFPGSYYLPDKLSAWKDKMVKYRWPEKDPGEPPPTKPIQVDDDVLDADRYMHEALRVGSYNPQDYVKRAPGLSVDGAMEPDEQWARAVLKGRR